MPYPWDIFLPSNWATFQNNMLAFLILKMDKGTSFLHLKASLSSYDSYLVVNHSATNAISYLLNRLTISRRSCLAIVCERGNSPPSTAWCQILHPPAVLKSNYLLPGKGRVSNARGMPPGGDVEVTN